MSALTWLTAIALLLVATLVILAVWSRRRLRLKIAVAALGLLVVPLANAALLDLLSRPKPTTLEWAHRHAERAVLLGADLREDEAIYVYLRLPDVPEPRSYVLPWDLSLAEQLQEAQREAERYGTETLMELPFDTSFEDRPVFHARPQEALPPKAVPESAVRHDSARD